MSRALLLLACAATGLPAQGPAPRPDLVTSVAALAGRLSDPALVIVQVDRDPVPYQDGHIPGARFLPLRAIVVERAGVPNELPEVAVLDSVLASVGISAETPIVTYGEPLAAARLFFTLDYLGLGDQASLLDGGLAAWKAAGQPVTRDLPPGRTGHLASRARPEVLIEAPELARRLGDSALVVLDARPPAEWSGSTGGEGVPRAGHIPGARSFFWRWALAGADPPSLKDPAVLAKLLGRVGLAPGREVITYCRTGVQASHLYYVARTLGYRPRMYDGSFLEWSRVAELPVER